MRLWTLGERESGHGAAGGGGGGLPRGAGGTDPRARAARLGDDAEQPRQCAAALGERESGTARLEEAVAAYRAALEERTRERVPLDWATTQNNLGNALRTLGERESGTARLEEAVAAYRAALEERTRERVPLDWAMTQNNLGNALSALGERESGTARLEEAVAAYPRGAGGTDPRARAARLGDDAEQPRQRAARRSASGRAARRGWRRRSAAYPRGAGGADPRARAARLGDDAEQPRQRALGARRAGERDGAAGGGGGGVGAGSLVAVSSLAPRKGQQCTPKARRGAGRDRAPLGLTMRFHSRKGAALPEEFRFQVCPPESENHVPMPDEPAWPTFIGEIEAFLRQ